MIDAPRISRRSFIVAGAALGGGLAIGINPLSSVAVVRAADGSPEITAWIVIHPDDTVVVRIARSEMGQGSLTGLAQLVAEELECDWNKVTWEYPTPGVSLARKKPWGPFGTGNSESIRGSQEYLRKAGAAARTMLVQAAANG
jgi:isoquinoline 1-oxidoreductase subunit beta